MSNYLWIVGIPLKNIVAFCSDTCNVMMGEHNSVASRLKQAIPHIMIIKCNCHIENLCFKHATTCIPDKYQHGINSIYTYINSKSSARLHRWKLAQLNENLKPINILKPSFTRWLSYCGCLRSMLRRWNVLKAYFEREQHLDNNAKPIYEFLCDPTAELYVKFLYSVLSKSQSQNERMQSVSTIFSETRASPTGSRTGLLPISS